MKPFRLGVLLSLLLGLAACSSLLPDGKHDIESPWKTYAEAEAMFAGIRPGSTTVSQLKAMGVDPQQTPNVQFLSYADLLHRLLPMVQFEGAKLDPAIAACVAARQGCFAYRIEQSRLDRSRVGNFWLDFLSFRRETHISGWQFDALIVVSSDVVVYKTWSGKPTVRETELEKHPLGPLQGIGSSLR